ncbi:hypothetical protein, partial [Brevibacterium sp. FAM 24638]|uniref:hypothetical protein n=1 Tax=Brevibacterium sp. FAM 24638 TaxID=3415681 RepID=UPI003C7B009A
AHHDADDVIAEFLWVGLWHGVYPSRLACVQARLDVTKPCISPISSILRGEIEPNLEAGKKRRSA